jgi:potassium efflux system protein
MIAAAKAQEQVLAIPGPSVLFTEFGDWSMKFNLICFVEDVEQAERTRSDINFEVLRRLREAGVRIAYPAPPPADVPWKFQPETKAAPPPLGPRK